MTAAVLQAPRDLDGECTHSKSSVLEGLVHVVVQTISAVGGVDLPITSLDLACLLPSVYRRAVPLLPHPPLAEDLGA